MKARRLPSNPGPAGWNSILPDTSTYPSLEGDQTADWLVIGAGFAGLSAARRLQMARPSDRIVVLDATRVAHGPAGRNSGFMIDLPHDLASSDYGGDLSADRATIAQNRSAIKFAARMVRDLAIPPEAFREVGKINAAATAKGMAHNAAYARHLSALNEPFTMKSAPEMQAMTGSRYYLGGLYTPGTVVLQPALYIRALASGLVAGGVTICENSPVMKLVRKRKAWIATTPAGKVTAPRVIMATNGHARSFGLFRGRLAHVYTFASMTRELTRGEIGKLGGQLEWGLTPADPLGATVRRTSGTGGDRIVIRSRFTYEPSMEVDPAKLDGIWATHDAGFAARFPMLPDMKMEYRWGGHLCLSRNNVPAFGEVKPGLFSACCQNGLGTVKGTLHGMLAAELALGESSDALTSVLALPQPKLLPPPPIARLGATAKIRWGEWRAGREI